MAATSRHAARQWRSSSLPPHLQRRYFHDYFVTHLPSTSLHPDSRTAGALHHKLPRDKSTPHNVSPTGNGAGTKVPPATAPHMTHHHPAHASRETTVVRIPLKSAKHHFGASVSRGGRPYNEDAFQAGTVDVPAFAKRQPISLTHGRKGGGGPADMREGQAAGAGHEAGDPQVFYFGVFDGHGGSECSGFLRERLHEYVEESSRDFELRSTLKGERERGYIKGEENVSATPSQGREVTEQCGGAKTTKQDSGTDRSALAGSEPLSNTSENDYKSESSASHTHAASPPVGWQSISQSDNKPKAVELERKMLKSWRDLVGGYFRRFKPQYFSASSGGQGDKLGAEVEISSSKNMEQGDAVGIETVLTYAFLKADLEFIEAQLTKTDDDPVLADRAINADEILDRPGMRSNKPIGGTRRFKGGSTCSVALLSTPTPLPFWNPTSPATLITSHVGDSRIILCETSTGAAIPTTTDHHPDSAIEAKRLRRFATSFTTDSFGEQRIGNLANTRAFGDMASKLVGVSAEPEIRRLELAPAEYSFIVLTSDGVSGTLTDQEIVDIVKEARTPEQAARDVVSFAVEVAADAEADNATALVVRMGGWERRGEGGAGSLGTKEVRDWKRSEAQDPRKGRT